MTTVFWVSMAVLAGFVFEFGRRLDVRKYPDVFAGLLVVIAGSFWLVVGLGKSRIPMPPDAVILILAGFAVMAGHYLYAELKAWRWSRPPQDRRRRTNTVVYMDDQGDLTRTVRSLERKSA